MKITFNSSGSIDAYIEDSILITAIMGSWTLEMHRESAIRARPFVEKLEMCGRPWGVIVQFVETMLTAPEVLLAGRKSVINMLPDTELVALAWVANRDIIGYPLLVPRYLEVYKDVLKSDFFSDIEKAKYWLNQEITAKRT